MDKVAGLTIDIDQDVEGTVSVNLKEIPWDQSLDLILRISGLDYAQAGDSIRVFKANDSKGLQLMAPPGI
jgi:type IV pilus assembly protein PilQ